MATVEFFGEQYAMAERIGLMPLMRFAKVSKAGVDTNAMEGLAALYDLLEQCIAPEDWQRFSDAADQHRADGDQLLTVVSEVFEVLSERPTSRPSDSSDGPSTTGLNSTGAASSALRQLHGRPDLAVAVVRAQEARTA